VRERGCTFTAECAPEEGRSGAIGGIGGTPNEFELYTGEMLDRNVATAPRGFLIFTGGDSMLPARTQAAPFVFRTIVSISLSLSLRLSSFFFIFFYFFFFYSSFFISLLY
jgi:hypothetical protein